MKPDGYKVYKDEEYEKYKGVQKVEIFKKI